MDPYQNYSAESMVNGWTRIDMLLALYDNAILTIRCAERASDSNEDTGFANKLVQANKYLLALHSGLDTEGNQIAVEIARLLNFVMLRLEEHNFDEAVYFLEKLRGSFEQIREEASNLENSGKIPPLNTQRGFNTVA